MASKFYQQSYISVEQIKTRDKVEELFATADEMKKVVENHQVYEPLKGMTIAILFYQPSTRTFSSFEAAARRLGAYTIAIHGMAQYSSVTKGETLEDTIRSIYQTTGADAIIIRHPENESSEVAASVSPVPVINAGSGTKEHPTQALLDLYTIRDSFPAMTGLQTVMVGDLLYGRTIKSLAKLLTVVDNKPKITFVAPKQLMAPRELVRDLQKKSKLTEKNELATSLKTADVVYMTRVQKEWFEKEGQLEEYEKLKDVFVMTKELANTMKPKSIIMHPLPRVGEIRYGVDKNPRAKYFSQMRSGLYVRMALLKSILVKE